jgi:hypothetical protein
MKAIVHKALDAALSYGEQVAKLQKLCKRNTPAQVRAKLLPLVANYRKYKVRLVPGAGKAEGTLVLDSEHPNYEACRKALNRLVGDVTGTSSGKAETPDIVAQALRLIGKMTAAQRRKVRAAL